MCSCYDPVFLGYTKKTLNRHYEEQRDVVIPKAFAKLMGQAISWVYVLSPEIAAVTAFLRNDRVLSILR